MSVRAVTWAFDQDLPPVEKIVLLALADEANSDGGSCFPSQSTIAQKASVSVRSVRRHLAELEQRGLLTRTPRQRKHGRGRTSDAYRLHLDQPASVSGWSDADQPDANGRMHDEDQPGSPEDQPANGGTTNRPATDDQPDTGVRGVLRTDPLETRERPVTPSVAGADAPDDAVVIEDPDDLVVAGQLGELLARKVGELTGEIPVVTRAWKSTLLTLCASKGTDELAGPDVVRRAILWAHRHDFWRTRIHSPADLQRHWSKLVADAQAARGRGSPVDDLLTLADDLERVGR